VLLKWSPACQSLKTDVSGLSASETKDQHRWFAYLDARMPRTVHLVDKGSQFGIMAAIGRRGVAVTSLGVSTKLL